MRLLLLNSILALGLGSASVAMAAPGKTGQGIMIDIKNSTDIAIVSDTIYSFDKVYATTFFNNVLNATSVACQGNPLTDCAAANKPATPPIPPPSQTEAENFAYAQRCLFLDGGFLTATRSYRQDIFMPGLNGRGTWRFNHEYRLSPAYSDVSPLTAWSVYQSGNPNATFAQINLQADIAGLSANNSSRGTKYSFSLRREDGSSRVKNLSVSVNGTQVATPSSTLVENCPGCKPGNSGAVDFLFNANAGSNGNTALLKNGDARAILNTDYFKGNDNGGFDGRALAKAVMNPVSIQLPIGTNNVSVSATVKEIDAGVSTNFTIVKQINVIAQGCSVP